MTILVCVCKSDFYVIETFTKLDHQMRSLKVYQKKHWHLII